MSWCYELIVFLWVQLEHAPANIVRVVSEDARNITIITIIITIMIMILTIALCYDLIVFLWVQLEHAPANCVRAVSEDARNITIITIIITIIIDDTDNNNNTNFKSPRE